MFSFEPAPYFSIAHSINDLNLIKAIDGLCERIVISVAASTLLGAAGEHYVMSLLLRQGFITALVPVGVPNCDIIVMDDMGDQLCAVQVKTHVDKGSDGGWHMSKKYESVNSPRLFYTFLILVSPQILRQRVSSYSALSLLT